MLRMGSSSPDKLTVAKVQVIHRRQGNFSRLIDETRKTKGFENSRNRGSLYSRNR